jgi:predicted AAA+ superfamily ATPase
MASKQVEFDAHKKVKKPTDISFTKKDGTEVDFVAKKKVEVPVHVKFKAKKT